MAHQFFFSPHILDNLVAPASGFDVVQDLAEPNLRMYITSRGVKSFFVRKRIGGRDRRIIIGNYPEINIDDARNRVTDVLKSAAAPRPTRRKKIEFSNIINLYMTKKVRRGEDGRTKLQRSINRHLSVLMKKNVSEITSSDIGWTLININGAAVRNRTQELLRSVFNFARDGGYIKTNPVADLPKVAETRRVRPLGKAGFMRMLRAIESEGDENIRAAFLMLIYGFAPKSKIFSMRWDDIDFNQYTWNDMPLSDRAVVLLESLGQTGDWVFTGRGGRHLTDPRMAWARVRRAARIENLTMDDVHKFVSRQLIWAAEREQLRNNMNKVLENALCDSLL